MDDNADPLARLRAQLIKTLPLEVNNVEAVRSSTARLMAVLQRDQCASDESVLLAAALAMFARDNHEAQTAALEMESLRVVVALRGPRGAAYSDRVNHVALAATLLFVRDHALAQAAAAHANRGVVAGIARALSSPTSSIVTLALETLLVLVTGASDTTQIACASVVVPLCHVVREGFARDCALAARVLRTLLDNILVVTVLQPLELQALAHVQPKLQQLQLESPAQPSSEPATTTALAVCVLLRVIRVGRCRDDDATVRSLLRELRALESEPDRDPHVVLLALEELAALLWSCDAPTADAAVDDGLVAVCLAWLLTSREDDEAVRNAAAFVLMGVLVHHTDERYHGIVRDAIAEDALVEQLSRGNLAVVLVLGPLVDGDDHARAEAAAAGAVAALASVLRDGCDQQKHVAARTLSRLVALDDSARDEALNANAMELLLRFLPSSAMDGRLFALTAIVCLTESTSRSHSAARDAFLRAGGAAVLVETLYEDDYQERVAAATVILTIASNHTVAQAAFVKAGAVAPLLQFFVAFEGCNECLALGCLAEYDASVKAALIADGRVVPRLVRLLNKGSMNETAYAADTLCRIATGDTTAQAAVAGAGAVDALVRVIQTGLEGKVFNATAALSAVVFKNTENRASAVRANGLQALAGVARRGGASADTAWVTLAHVLGYPESGGVISSVRLDVFKRLVGMLEQEWLASAQTMELLVTIGSAEYFAALDAGAVAALIAVVSDSERQQAAASATRALVCLVTDGNAATTFALERHAIMDVLVEALRTEEHVDDRPALLKALRCLLPFHAEAQPELLLVTRVLSPFRELKLLDATISVSVAEQAVVLVWKLALGGDPRTIDALWEADVVAPFVATLRCLTGATTLVYVLESLQRLATDVSRLATLCELFPLEDVIAMIPTASDMLKFSAMDAISVIAEHDSARRRLAIDRGMLAVAVDTISERGSYRNAILCGCSWVMALVSVDAYAERVAVEELGVVELLCGLIPTLQPQELSFVAIALASIRAAQSEAMASGVLEPLLELLGSNTDGDDSLAATVCALANLVERHTVNQTVCADAGAIPLVLALVAREASTSVGSIWRRRHAARALAGLVDGNAHVKRLAVREGVVEQLTELLKASHGLDEPTSAHVQAALAQLEESQQRDEEAVSGSVYTSGSKAESPTAVDAAVPGAVGA